MWLILASNLERTGVCLCVCGWVGGSESVGNSKFWCALIPSFPPVHKFVWTFTVASFHVVYVEVLNET